MKHDPLRGPCCEWDPKFAKGHIPIPKVGHKEAHSEFWRRAEGPRLADHLPWLVVGGVLVMQLFFWLRKEVASVC